MGEGMEYYKVKKGIREQQSGGVQHTGTIRHGKMSGTWTDSKNRGKVGREALEG